MKALLIPADPARDVKVIEVNGRDDLRQQVGGVPEPTRYDSDALMFVSDTGRLDGKAMNTRATDYIRSESEAAQQGRMIGTTPSYGLYGDVVAIGDGGFAGMRDVPDRLVTRFTPRPEVVRSIKDDEAGTEPSIESALGHADALVADHHDKALVEASEREARILDEARGYERNEDGMLRLPRVSPNWLRAVSEDSGEIRYQWWDGKAEGIVWKEDGQWKMHFTFGDGLEDLHVDLGRTRFVNKALSRADDVIGMAQALPAAEHEQLETELGRPSFERDYGHGYDLGQ